MSKGKTVTGGKAAGSLSDFIVGSPNAFFAVKNLAEELLDSGYVQLFEKDSWALSPGEYFVTRDDSSLIAFRIPKRDFVGFAVIASHSDSPAFKIKPDPDISVERAYKKLNVEKYGGMIVSTWFDRPLSAAGRVVLETDEGIGIRLVDLDRDLFLIPSLAIHMDRTAGEGHKYEIQKEVLPLFSGFNDSGAVRGFCGILAETMGVEERKILDYDMFLYNREKPVIFGADREFIAAPRLDDLQCVYASFQGFINSKPSENAAVFAVFNNEEVGSGTKQGAASDFFSDVVERICLSLDPGREEVMKRLFSSFMISADNAHALHPNYTEKADPVNRPVLNGGIVVKYNAAQRYATDAVSAGVIKKLCRDLDIPVQQFVNHSDIAGGSTLGSIASSRVFMNTVDLGLPMLAMHSAYETAGVKDTEYLEKLAEGFYSAKCIQQN